MPNLLRYGSYPSGIAGQNLDYKPMNADLTLVPASLRASAKIEDGLPDRSNDPYRLQGISRLSDARNRNST